MVKQLARLPQHPPTSAAREGPSNVRLFSAPRWHERSPLYAGASPASAHAYGHDFTRIAVQPQAKLTVSQPGDPAEQEADRVADHVMRKDETHEESEVEPSPAEEVQKSVMRTEAPEEQTTEELPAEPEEEGDESPLQRKCAECEQEEQQMARQASGDSALGQDVSDVVEHGLSGGGQPLDAQTQEFMEPRFGHDFSRVRVHTDPKAGQSAQAVSARLHGR